MSRPTGNQRYADSAVGHATLVSGDRAVGIEEIRIVLLATFLVRPVIGREKDYGLVVEPEFMQLIEELADKLVHARDHGRLAFERTVPIATSIRTVVGDFLTVAQFLAAFVIRMGHDEAQIKEKGILAMFLDKTATASSPNRSSAYFTALVA